VFVAVAWEISPYQAKRKKLAPTWLIFRF